MDRRVFSLLAALLILFAAVSAARAQVDGTALYPHREREAGPWGYIDHTGQTIISPRFQWVDEFAEGLAAVRLNGKLGYTDATGRLVVEPQFDSVRPFRNGRAAVRVGKEWGFIDRSGGFVAQPRWALAWSFNDDLAVVTAKSDAKTKQKTGAIDLSGRVAVEPEYEAMGEFSEGLVSARRDGKYGYVDKDGKVVIPFQFEQAFAFQDGRATVLRDASGRSGFIDRTGTLVVPLPFDMVYEFSEGLAVVWAKGKGYGAIDAAGQLVISPQFSAVASAEFEPNFRKRFLFSSGLLPVSYCQGFGYVDRSGNFVIHPQFARASPFRGDLAVVHVRAEAGFGVAEAKGEFAGLIDRSGKFAVPPIYDWIRPRAAGLMQVKFGERLGYLDATGRPRTFLDKDIEEHIAQTRERLMPPPPPAPGRAISAKAGETDYHLLLPNGICVLDAGLPADLRLIDDIQTSAKVAKPPIGEPGGVPPVQARVGGDFKLFAKCDELHQYRVSGERRDVRTVGSATGLQKGRYDPSANAALIYMRAFLCGRMQGDLSKGLRPQETSARIWVAFKKLEAGEAAALPGIAQEPLACYSAWLGPETEGVPAQLPTKGKVTFHSILLLPDWLVQIFTHDVLAGSPKEFLENLEHEKALTHAFQKSNLKK